jgi:hypothetical protein
MMGTDDMRRTEMSMGIKVTSRHSGIGGGTWYIGRVGTYHFQALVFAEPSQYGIDGGQVSKFYLLDKPRKKSGKELAVYDRGWELEPAEADRPVVETLLAELSRREREQ